MMLGWWIQNIRIEAQILRKKRVEGDKEEESGGRKGRKEWRAVESRGGEG